ncbi:C25 family cysteine peptidase [Fusibacter bizertensis]
MEKKIIKIVVMLIISISILAGGIINFADTQPKETNIQNRYVELATILKVMDDVNGDFKLDDVVTISQASDIFLELFSKKIDTTSNTYQKKNVSIQPISCEDYVTNLLSVLGYTKGTDFTAQNVNQFAMKNGLMTEDEIHNIEIEGFNRYFAARLNAKALMLPLKGQKLTLFESLVSKGKINKNQLLQIEKSGWHITQSDGVSKLSYPDIFFEDKELETWIQFNIVGNDGKPTKQQLSSLRYLWGGRLSVERLEGIELLTGLENITLEVSNIKDISYLKNIETLKEVNLNYAKIKDPNALIYLLNSQNLTSVKLVPRDLNFKFDPYVLKKHKNASNLKILTNDRIYNFGAFILPQIKDITNEKQIMTPYLPNKKCDYLILIENSNQLKSVLDFYNFKKSQGYNVGIQSAKLIADSGKPRYSSIHTYLIENEDKYDLDYVLLIGNPYNPEKVNREDTGSDLPMPYQFYEGSKSFIYNGTSASFDVLNESFHDVFNFPTDGYYCFRNPSFYREFDFGKFRNTLMFSIGRIPFSNPTNIESVLRNTINYKNKSDITNVLIAGGRGSFPNSAFNQFESSSECSTAMNYFKNLWETKEFSTKTMYETKGDLKSIIEPDLELDLEKFTTEFNRSDIVFSSGHSGTTSLYWFDSNKNGIVDDEIFFNQFMERNKISGTAKFMFMDGCETAIVEKQEDEKMSNYNGTDILSLMYHGNIVSGIGTSRSTWVDNSQENTDILYSINSINDKATFADLYLDMVVNLFSGNSERKGNLTDIFYYNYFGDPSLKILN